MGLAVVNDLLIVIETLGLRGDEVGLDKCEAAGLCRVAGYVKDTVADVDEGISKAMGLSEADLTPTA